MRLRKPVFAGSWYPGDRNECRKAIESFLHEERFKTDLEGPKKVGIVPHAGWPFSGDLACSVFASLAKNGDTGRTPDVIALFGMHMPPGVAPVIMKEGAWDTPLGAVEVAEALGERMIRHHDFQIETPTAFAPENTIELQMPFVKYFFDGAKVLTIGPPADAAAVEIGKTLVHEAQALGLDLKIIGSTDLTHYGPNFSFTPAGSGRSAYEWVRDKNDRQVIEKMLALDAKGVIEEALAHHNACCPGAAAAAIAAANALGAGNSDLLGYSSSYEINPGSTFVGYTGVVYAG